MNLDSPFFSPLDRLLARFLSEQSRDDSPLFRASVALVSRFVRDGHVCLPLGVFAGTSAPLPEWPEMPSFSFPEIKDWRKALLENKLVGKPGEEKPIIINSEDFLYLCRYWDYENKLIQYIKRTALTPVPEIRNTEKMLDSLFGPEKDNLQRKAAETALQKRLLIISGGPGCGKTWAAVRIIRLLKELAGQNVVLCAPTGKAAARLQSSLRETGGELLPGNVMTLHRLLKPVPDTPGFRHHAGNPLACDTLVVDEASMIDLPLFAKLTDAMPENGRLILLGDRHQLASVESGAALNDLCLAAQDPSSFLHGHLVELVKSMRFREGDAISVLGRLIREGRAEEAHAFAADQGLFHPARRDDPLGDLLLNKLSPFLESYSALEDPVAMLDRLDELKILCVLNVTPFGVDAVNERVERIFRPADPAAYPGMPILVLENDYRNGLFNGDSGVLFPDNGALKACFRSPEGGVRMFEPSRLPRHQKAWALTVHKSQGSEFGEAVLVLPGFDSPLLTRELLYTAVTRARRGIEIWGEKDLFIRGIRRKIRRFSGLADGLGPQPTPANRKSP